MKSGRSIFYLVILTHCIFVFASAGPAQNLSAVDVRLVTDEAEAVLNILAKKKADQPITSEDWQRVFQSEGYLRLKKRELATKNSFEDGDFKIFVLSDKLLEQKQTLEETLDKWKRADTSRAARLAVAYLPKNARIKANIYPVIKLKKTVSFSM